MAKSLKVGNQACIYITNQPNQEPIIMYETSDAFEIHDVLNRLRRRTPFYKFLVECGNPFSLDPQEEHQYYKYMHYFIPNASRESIVSAFCDLYDIFETAIQRQDKLINIRAHQQSISKNRSFRKAFKLFVKNIDTGIAIHPLWKEIILSLITPLPLLVESEYQTKSKNFAAYTILKNYQKTKDTTISSAWVDYTTLIRDVVIRTYENIKTDVEIKKPKDLWLLMERLVIQKTEGKLCNKHDIMNQILRCYNEESITKPMTFDEVKQKHLHGKATIKNIKSEIARLEADYPEFKKHLKEVEAANA